MAMRHRRTPFTFGISRPNPAVVIRWPPPLGRYLIGEQAGFRCFPASNSDSFITNKRAPYVRGAFVHLARLILPRCLKSSSALSVGLQSGDKLQSLDANGARGRHIPIH